MRYHGRPKLSSLLDEWRCGIHSLPLTRYVKIRVSFLPRSVGSTLLTAAWPRHRAILVTSAAPQPMSRVSVRTNITGRSCVSTTPEARVKIERRQNQCLPTDPRIPPKIPDINNPAPLRLHKRKVRSTPPRQTGLAKAISTRKPRIPRPSHAPPQRPSS